MSIDQKRQRNRQSYCTCILAFLFAALAAWSTKDLRAEQAEFVGATGPTAPYKIQPGDTISVFYRLTPEYNQTLTVLPDGAVTLHLIGRIHVSGLDVEGVRTAITNGAAKRLREPDVSVTISDFVRDQFSVMGEVSRPGRFELHGMTTLADALATAGGFTSNSSQRRVILVRSLGQGSEYGNATTFDFKQLTSLVRSSSVPVLQTGDIVIVTTSKFAKVSGLIKLINIGLYYNPLPSL